MRNSECWYVDVCPITDKCNPYCIRYVSMKYLMEHSNIPKSRWKPQVLKPPKCDYDAFCRLADIKDDIQQFIKDGKSLYITSTNTGNGKTTWAVKLLTRYFDRVWAGNGIERIRGLFIHVPTFLLKCKEFGKNDPEFEEIKANLSTVDVVVWDDIASTEISAYDCSQLLMYIDARVSGNLSNIYTGNLNNPESMKKAIGAKLTSRVWSSDTEIVEFMGGDKR